MNPSINDQLIFYGASRTYLKIKIGYSNSSQYLATEFLQK